ncbi:hemicentin-1-like isoform X2 [Planococcus citri]|uniref:hemicentin-1-like isoform X2 n=1 Tax=Planococcus citri TaxID=170843 RepID=UPI0031F79338
MACSKNLFNMLVFIGVLLCAKNSLTGIVPVEEAVSFMETEAVAGGVAMLSCNITPPFENDLMYLVIWYKEGLSSPIYSYDSRDKTTTGGSHWADDKTVGGRVTFELGSGKYPARLTLQAVRDSDGGLYRCRVDFKKSPTRNQNVNLTVILPPDSLSVINEKGDHIPNYILGPYAEGSSVNITCIATGGRPPPRVTWWQENALLDETFEKLPNRQIRNVLRLEKLERKHLNAVFTCQASNNNLVAPISSAVTLDLILKPLSVKILGENRPFSAENKYNISCQVVGARPPPRVTWWKGNTPLKSTKKVVSDDSNTTTGVVTFTPSVDDFGKTLTCRAESQYPSENDRVYEDSWKLNVHHIPIVSLAFGSKLNSSIIREGVDVYFECNIKSNPWVYKVNWRFNGKTIHNNPSKGMLVSNQSLVLQKVSRMEAGLYTCVGSNQEGDGESSPLYLDVKYAPICRPGQETTYGVGRGEVALIACEIEANPTDLKFVWKFNNTSGSTNISSESFRIEGTRSVAKFIPTTELDYGSLYCWASNQLGMQSEPCVYHIIPAGRPDPVSNCSITNRTYDALSISCDSGFDGGLSQEFGMEVYETFDGELIRNSTGSEPVFTVTGLFSGVEYDIRLYAYNSKGRSRMVPIQAFTLKSPQKHVGITPAELDLRSLIGVFVGTGVSVILLICIVIVIKVRCRSSNKNKKEIHKQNSNSVDSVEKDPDIIPHNEEYLDEDEKAFERLNNSSRCYGVQCIRDNCTLPKPMTNEEITYAELSLPRNIHPVDVQRISNNPRSHIEEPTIYAQIETCTKIDADITQETPLLNGHHRESMKDTDLFSRNPCDPSNPPQFVATRF